MAPALIFGYHPLMHVFLSYSRADEEITHLLTSVLRASGVRPWIDSSGLPPGTPQWDQVIRDALEKSHGVIALCSENARESEFVAIELEIAKGYQKRIFPVWVSGTRWSQSAPVALVLSQYVDLRSSHLGSGLRDLIEAQRHHLATLPMPPDDRDKWPYLQVTWGERQLWINPFAFPNWGELLSNIYLSLLKDDLPPFSYGERWALEISASAKPFDFWSWPVFALPAKWAATPFVGVHVVDPDWVHAPGNLELVAILSGSRERSSRGVSLAGGQHARSSVRVVDLRTLKGIANTTLRGLRDNQSWNDYDQRRNFIGMRCGWGVFDAIAAGAHPKMTYMRLSETLRREHGREYPDLPAQRYEMVTIQTDYFDFTRSYFNFSDVRQTDNIIDFP